MDGSVEELAAWSPWVPWDEAAILAPKSPGVFLGRSPESLGGAVVFVGAVGLHSGSGIKGQLTVPYRGTRVVGGLADAALEQALNDPAWLSELLSEMQAGDRRTLQWWTLAALDRADLKIRWVECDDSTATRDLYRRVIDALGPDSSLWNHRRSSGEDGGARSANASARSLGASRR